MNDLGLSSVSKYYYFDITLSELQTIMDHRGREGFYIIERFGGIDEIASKLKTSTLKGISTLDSNMKYRKLVFGTNVIPKPKQKSIFRLMADCLKDPTLIILICAALISLILSNIFEESRNQHEWIEGAAILIAVLVVVLVTSINDFSKELQFRRLQRKLDHEHNFTVIRDGRMIEIYSHDILSGDICILNYGDLIPADGILTHGLDLKIDESTMTGETEYVLKNPDTDIMLYTGTKVMEGSGKMLALTVGTATKYGIILTLLGINETKKKKNKENARRRSSVRQSIITMGRKISTSISHIKDSQDETIEYQAARISVLQAKLLKLAVKIGYIGTTIAILTVMVLVIRLLITKYAIKHESWEKKNYQDLVRYFIIGISVLVVAVPEGLPLAVTISLAYSVRKMMKDNNLVRHLDACETMGNATTICSDKTGTLTENRMTVVQFYICERLYFKMPEINTLDPNIESLFTIGVTVNSSYKSKLIPPSHQGQITIQIGNKTECALLGLVNTLGISYEEIRLTYPTEIIVYSYSFNSARKFMSTVIETDKGYRLFIKGAAEKILEMCDTTYNIKNEKEPLTPEMKSRLFRLVIETMARQGLRTLVMAHRDFPFNPVPNWRDENSIHNNLTFICCVGIEDPVRREVPKAIEMCQKAGIVVRMVTGDNIDTAISIALKCGIIHPNDGAIILDSAQFNNLIRDADGKVDQDLFDLVWPHLRILARSTPYDKYILVKYIIKSNLNNERQIVAVTGDGTNDGPALKESDVGFAMGIAGTDVAKEASDIIITDDNFYSIVKAVMWGRNVYDSISKFLQFQLTVNCVAVTAAFIGACLIEFSPLKAIQLLWVNIIMDTLASLALATETPTAEILNRKPYGRYESLVSKRMMKAIIGQSILQLSILFFLIFADTELIAPHFQSSEGKLSERLTVVFNSLVVMTLFNELNARKLHGELNIFKGILKNKIFLCVWVSTFCAQILIVQYGGIIFSCKNLKWEQWLWCLFFGVLVLIWGFILNLIPTDKKVWDHFKSFNKSNSHSIDIIPIGIKNADFERGVERTNVQLFENREPLLLWIQNVQRIRSQLRVIKAFSFRG